MDTTKKGDKLEKRIYKIINAEIANNRWPIKKENCRVYAKKGYYSNDRKKDIVFDISIEVYLPGQERFSFLILIECKNYNHSVPVDDAEEFFQKLQQVSGGNVKGIIAASNSFQEGTINFSESKGLGLIRYYDESNLSWVLTRSPSNMVTSRQFWSEWNIAYNGITSEEYKSDFLDLHCYANNQYTNSLYDFSEILLYRERRYIKSVLNKKKNKGFVRYISDFEVEKISRGLLRKIEYTDGRVPIDLICSNLIKNMGLKIFYHNAQVIDNNKNEILGRIVFSPFEIHIYDDSSENKDREKFTLAHELGHYYLGHSKYMTEEICKENHIDLEKIYKIGIVDIMRMEWQANNFASCILMPKENFVKDIKWLAMKYGLFDKGFGLIYLDKQSCNQEVYYRVAEQLMRKYEVSRTAIKIRMKN